jgi:phage tail protein X
MKKHIGSTIALVFGVLAILSGLAKPGPILFSGIVIILGALAYRSAKKRKLGEVTNSLLRKALEITGVIIAIASVALQKNFLQVLEADPVPNLIIPLWVVIAYILISMRKPKQHGESNA